MQPEFPQAPEGADTALSLKQDTIPLTPWSAALVTIVTLFRQKTGRRQLAGLSDRQLRDAGIDLSLVRCGPAVAARPDPNLEGMR